MRSYTPIHRLALLLTLIATASPGCGDDAEEAPAPAAEAPAPPAPEHLAAELVFGQPTRVLAGIREQISSPMVAATLPLHGRDLLGRITALPDALAERVPTDATLRGLMLNAPGVEGWIYAVRVPLEPDAARPLGPDAPVSPGAPHGAAWVMGEPSLEHPPIALKGDVLLVATDVASLEAALPYLVHRAASEEAPSALDIRIPTGVVARRGRALADAQLAELTRSAMAGAEAERSQHQQAPTLGEPEQFVSQVRGPLARWVALLPDVGEVRVRLDVGSTGIVLRAEADVSEGSPLAARLGDASVGDATGLSALPTGAALALLDHGAGDADWVEPLAEIAGDRIDAEGRAKLNAWAIAVEASRGETTLRALGADPAGAWALIASRGGEALDEDALLAALSVGYVETLVGTLVGCEGDASPHALEDAGEGSRVAPLCRRSEGSAPRLELATAGSVVALALTRNPGEDAPPHPAPTTVAGAWGGSSSRSLGAAPDIARAVSALGNQTISAFLLSPSRLLPAASLLAAPGLPAAGGPLGDPAPTLLAISRREGGVELQLIITPHGIDSFVEVGVVGAALLGR